MLLCINHYICDYTTVRWLYLIKRHKETKVAFDAELFNWIAVDCTCLNDIFLTLCCIFFNRTEIHMLVYNNLYFFRVATVLSHLDVMNNTALQYKEHLMRLQEKVAETQQVM